MISNFSGREEKIFNLKRAVLKGAHNCENYLAAAAAALIAGISHEIIGGVFEEFSSLPHHIEFVRRLRGVSYIDDSKATNLDATKSALQTFPAGKIILILGGRDKGCCFHRLSDILVKKRVKQIILLGEAAKRIENELSGCSLPIRKVSSLEEAVKLGKKLAKKGDFVLLSPACSSFDMFADYKERGNVFKRAVQNLS